VKLPGTGGHGEHLFPQERWGLGGGRYREPGRCLTQPADLGCARRAAAQATLDGKRLPNASAYGWAHAWPLTHSGTVAVTPPSSLSSGALLTLAIVAHHFVAMGAVVIVPDPARVIDAATYDDPHRYPVGIEYVIVNGGVALEAGETARERHGRFLRQGRDLGGR